MLRILQSLCVITLARAASTQYVRRTQEADNSTVVPEIVGGSVASSGEFPWFAAFVPLVQCGGSLIAPNRVLTAAHCVVGGTPSSVRIGASTTSDGEEIAVTCGQYHPDYEIGPQGVSSCGGNSLVVRGKSQLTFFATLRKNRISLMTLLSLNWLIRPRLIRYL